MSAPTYRRAVSPLEIVVFAALVFIAAALVIGFISALPLEDSPLGWDWRLIWTPIQGGRVNYAEGSMRVTPWGVLPLLPLGLLSFRISWGILSLITLTALVASVPHFRRRRDFWLAALLLISSFPALRLLADGNIEGIIILGILLILYGARREAPLALAAGLLVATAKPQIVWLLAAGVGVYALFNWPARRWLAAFAIVAGIAIPALIWQGTAWAAMMARGIQVGSDVDVSLLATADRLGLSAPLHVMAWIGVLGVTIISALRNHRTFDRRKAALLVAASMLLAPYVSGISYSVVFAVGVIGLLPEHPRLGIAVIALNDVFYLLPQEFMRAYSPYLNFALIFTNWLIFCWWVPLTPYPLSHNAGEGLVHDNPPNDTRP